MPVSAILKKLEKGIRFIENALVVLSGAIFLVMMFLGTADVLGRTILNKPILGTYEFSEIMMGAIVLLGWAYTQKEGEHVAVDLFYNIFPTKMKTISSIVVYILSLALFIVIMIESWKIALASIAEGRHFIIVHFPSGPFYLLVPVGAFFICLEFIVRIVHFFGELRKKQ